MTFVYCEPVSDVRRIEHTAALFGLNFPRRLEPTAFTFAERLSPDYHGGFWQFYALSNGGFFMAPQAQEAFAVICENGFEGHLSADALGLAVCLYAYSNLSFLTGEGISEFFGKHYHLLRAFMLDHAEADLILQAID